MKKGFTLIELLAVIVVLALILAIAIPKISPLINNSQLQAYQANEKLLVKAAKTYLGTNSVSLPSDTQYGSVLPLNTLVNNGYMGIVTDVKNNSTICEGYVIIIKIAENNFQYDPYLKCGSNYETSGYKAETLTVNRLPLVEVLIVAGGGGGGYRHGAGGGAGGLIYNATYAVSPNASYSLTVGNGGSGSTGGQASSGGNSIFNNLVALGGGGAGQWDTYLVGKDGGSGGGSANAIRSKGTNLQGNDGGKNSTGGHPYNHGGGGGAGAPGGDGNVASCGDGGIGLYYGDKFGTTYGANGWFAGGGGGGTHDPAPTDGLPGYGGQGGGGNGGTPSINNPGQDGVANTGGGGGGASTQSGGNSRGGNGGSGIVLIRYPGAPIATGGTITTQNGYTVHAFTTVGSSNFIVNSF